MQDTPLKFLLLEDSEMDAMLLVRFLKKSGIDFSYTRVWEENSYISELVNNNYDLVISDHSLPNFSGKEAFHIVKNRFPHLPFIVVTGTMMEHTLAEITKAGVDDYILKDNLLRLPSAIHQVISKKKIERLHYKLEKAYKDVTDSINYAMNIQNAVFPSKSLLAELFPESFILFQPRDCVSGDFYYFERDEKITYIIVADCTGHGVPGAFLSILGIEKLKSLLITQTEPAEILRKLNIKIKKALSHSSTEDSSEGMDIAITAFDSENNTLKFAGANRPLWIKRKGKEELEEIKGDKKGIGHSSDHSIDKDFLTHEIKLEKGDTFYMSSDGLADQFGGPKGKKITSKKLKRFLSSMQEKSMSEEKLHLINFLEEWQEDEEQVDDILILGVRV